MKGVAKAILLGGFMVAAQAAMAADSAFPGAADDAGISLPANVTYASEHANDRAMTAGSAFPGSAPEGYFLDPNVTYASEHANDRAMTAGSAFPGADDDAGIYLPARSTYADTHLNRPAQASRPAEGAGADAD